MHLNSYAKDQLFPDVCELVVSMDRMTALPETIKEPVKLWESTLKPMNASDEITGMLTLIIYTFLENIFPPLASDYCIHMNLLM